MRRWRLLWHLYPSYVIIVFAALLAVTWYVSDSVTDFYYARTASDLGVRARLIEEHVRELLEPVRPERMDALCKQVWRDTRTRVTVILPSGKVIGDSLNNPAKMENHADRPEVAAALGGKTGQSVRLSGTLRQRMMYVAVPVTGPHSPPYEGGAGAGGQVIAAVRASIPLTAVDHALGFIRSRIIAVGLVTAILAAIVSMLISRRVSRPIEEMQRGAEQFAAGDLHRRMPLTGSYELASLAESLNEMASQLGTRMGMVLEQRNEREAILTSMTEGVVAVDVEQSIIEINKAAAELLGVNEDEVTGRSIQEAVRNPNLQHVVARTLSDAETTEGELVIYNEQDRYIQARGAVMRGVDGGVVGAVVVLNDITRIRRLERIRRDFVANVSHELKTPITTIKGFIETLQNGGLEDQANARRFLKIMAKDADRLNSIIDDLLELSRIEEATDKLRIDLDEWNLREVIEGVVDACESRARAKKVAMDIQCPGEIDARINRPLLERAIENLVDNAIKYSPADSQIRVACEAGEGKIAISVANQGPGIEPQHLSRLFERFYRVDTGRSRSLGGTGLGLAIVKHIAQAHGGSATVESVVGKGTTFTIHLPI